MHHLDPTLASLLYALPDYGEALPPLVLRTNRSSAFAKPSIQEDATEPLTASPVHQEGSPLLLAFRTGPAAFYSA